MASHDDVTPELERCDTQYFEESDWRHLGRLRDVVAEGADGATAAAVLADIGSGRRNGMVAAMESDVKGLYGIEPSPQYRYVPKTEFAGLDGARLRALVLARIDALRPGVCDVPESVFRVDIHTIEIDGELIAVREIARKDWDYLLYEAREGPPAHYVEIEYGSHAMYSVAKRISPEDSQLLSAGALSDVEIDRLVDRYR